MWNDCAEGDGRGGDIGDMKLVVVGVWGVLGIEAMEWRDGVGKARG